MAWTRKPRDTGDLDITSTLSDITAGSVFLARIGQQVWLDFQDVTANAQNGNTLGGEQFLRWRGAIPVGYRPPRIVDLPMMGRAAQLTGGPARISVAGEIVIYRHAGTIRGLITWFTREAMPTGGA